MNDICQVRFGIYFSSGSYRSIVVLKEDAFDFKDEWSKGDVSGNCLSIRGIVNDVEVNEVELTFNKHIIDAIEIMALK